MRWFLTMAAGLAAAALVVGGASAKQKVHCDVMPFTFDNGIVIDVDFGPTKARVEWEAMGSTTVDCPEPLGVLGVDVWEHAYYVVNDSGRVGGRAQIVIDFTSAGIVPFEGSIRGRTPGDDTIDVIMRATSPGGAKLELEQTGTFDLDAETIEDLEVTQGFLFKIEALP
ncbi:MAG TPA: hypothetical protein VFR32_01425 [Gaiellaceae bacterium]|nr:hypothetical protein [Gaiellaceae bacterium]